MKKFISYEESLEKLSNLDIKPISFEEVFISDSLDRILAIDIIADENSPKYPTSSMDGYAIKFEDQKLKKLRILRDNPAGTHIEDIVEEGTCIKTFTGSLMPKGTDTLIPIEMVDVVDDDIIINEEVKKQFAIREVGENYKKDEILIKKGTKIGYAEIGVMASLNIPNIKVSKKPMVAIACTGSEILDVGEEQTNEAQIRSSNHLTIEALAKKYGADVYQMGIVKDDKDSITDTIKKALENSDIVVTTGGVSVGDYDFVKEVVIEELDAKLIFQGVRIKPGQHIIVAKKDEKIIISLPGFAYSSTVTFILYGVPLILQMLGSSKSLEIVDAILDEDKVNKIQKTAFAACNLALRDGEYHVDFEGKRMGSSAILTNMLYGTVLLIQDEDTNLNKKGDKVKVLKV